MDSWEGWEGYLKLLKRKNKKIKKIKIFYYKLLPPSNYPNYPISILISILGIIIKSK